MISLQHGIERLETLILTNLLLKLGENVVAIFPWYIPVTLDSNTDRFFFFFTISNSKYCSIESALLYIKLFLCPKSDILVYAFCPQTKGISLGKLTG